MDMMDFMVSGFLYLGVGLAVVTFRICALVQCGKEIDTDTGFLIWLFWPFYLPWLFVSWAYRSLIEKVKQGSLPPLNSIPGRVITSHREVTKAEIGDPEHWGSE